ncbi:hypothetical protein [Arthrobacter sp. 31Y]|uniref:hypothetical protein n=1 Tax=Arthrobacter sp. 31Y TaxID=1115632 RepID=UPI000686F32F|nr:hypothetical protein [Arthrobacter sp. 31Y]
MSSNLGALLSSAAVGTAVGTAIVRTAVVSAGDASRATVSGALRTTIGASISATVRTAVVSAGDASRATVSGALRTTIGASISTTVRTAVVSAGDTGRTAVRGALLLVWILLWIRHASSRESNGVLRPRFRRPISTRAIFQPHRP